MHGVEDLGLLKMDFLGLRNLDVIEQTREIIRESRGVDVDIDAIPSTTSSRSRCCSGATRSACSSSRAAPCGP